LIWKSTKSRKEIQKKFNKTSNDIHYKNLKNVTKIIGIYDDHDFNCNNGDKDFKGKREIAELYLDFIEEEIESERRNIESR
jgi:alkaline phosphatase D